jgi:hypothetical protein
MNHVDVDSAKDEQEVVNDNYTFTVQTTIIAISGDEHIPVSGRGIDVNIFND